MLRLIVSLMLLLTLVSAAPTAAQTPEATPDNPRPAYVVQFAEGGDPHSIYAEPDQHSAVVGMLFNGEEIEATGDTLLVGDTLWLPIRIIYDDQPAGWIERYYAAPKLSAEDFCADTAGRELVNTVRAAIRAQDGAQLAELVIPARGLYIAGLNWSDSVHLSQAEVRTFFSDTTPRDWGTNGYSDAPIQGTLPGLIVPLLKRDLLAKHASVSCAASQDSSSYGMLVNDARMSALSFYSVMRPGTKYNELAWGAWALGIDYWEGEAKLAYLVWYEWTP